MTEDIIKNQGIDIFHKILFIIFTFSLLYLYYNKPTTTIVHYNQKPEFKLLGPDNTTTVVPVTDNYTQLIDISDFEFKINPDICKDYPAGLLLLIIIASNPRRDKNRMAIRETWGQDIDSTKVVFLLGDPVDDSLADKIAKESATYGDIVQGNFVDAYRNMTYKHVMGLKWAAHHCPTARYILKADDDVVVNILEMRHFLTRELSPWGARDLIACPTMCGTPVLRSGKWKATTDEFPNDTYPDYCSGYSVLYSQDVIPRLLAEAQRTPYFWIDDVHVTGTLVAKAKVPLTSLYALIPKWKKFDLLRKYRAKYDEPFLYGPVNQNPERIEEIWQDFYESDSDFYL